MVEEMKAMAKCLENGIKIYPEAIDTTKKTKVYLIINNGGKITRSKEIYDQKVVHKKIYELYLHIAKQI